MPSPHPLDLSLEILPSANVEGFSAYEVFFCRLYPKKFFRSLLLRRILLGCQCIVAIMGIAHEQLVVTFL